MKTKCLIMVIALALAGGCYTLFGGGPGYAVDMDTTLKSKEQLEEIKQLLSDLGFSVWRHEIPSGGRIATIYRKSIPEIEKNLYISLHYKPNGNAMKGQIEIGLLIGDAFDGWENPVLRTRINELGDLLYGFLVEKVGKENIKIKRTRVGIDM